MPAYARPGHAAQQHTRSVCATHPTCVFCFFSFAVTLASIGLKRTRARLTMLSNDEVFKHFVKWSQIMHDGPNLPTILPSGICHKNCLKLPNSMLGRLPLQLLNAGMFKCPARLWQSTNHAVRRFSAELDFQLRKLRLPCMPTAVARKRIDSSPLACDAYDSAVIVDLHTRRTTVEL